MFQATVKCSKCIFFAGNSFFIVFLSMLNMQQQNIYLQPTTYKDEMEDLAIDAQIINMRNVGQCTPMYNYNSLNDDDFKLGMIMYDYDDVAAADAFKKSWANRGNSDAAFFVGKLAYLRADYQEAQKYFALAKDDPTCWYATSIIDYLFLLKLKGK